ncbi:Coenzyme F420-reducing hydrogenase, beta subunit [Intestinibacter bartlettii DSM 16795]|uniref:Coenzyme F420 hydrogenase/dehydrogenase, beta subunit C-terminal domain n=1 Tax=Intestinibacter bartlettii TaxID=261299 RepID=UPI0001631247|nr:Coenzyme F420 hydrogenase/dehydrogenase, beta subunit C-terminal domain [Intestinibacter bartlettii]EDQ95614.1 4Fe-4S binding domain protein [Intestinibacter bartlettii DSM 16795]UWO80605.1 Coenzyme F420 hydrogenase/dehydrogenase, beta subunit C-terminal domain [Intestinibacter bartlettii]SKA58628.1 Coenzyme F420-reducing hydrogenase, beta subunit [Intestinibacter bartlettii DSM 16795]
MIDIVDKKDCTGCWGCANICPKSCITMKKNKEGFDYPIVNEDDCIKCKKCINVCPILHKEEIENNAVAYACFNKDEEVRIESSSGGIFTLIATNVIKDNGVVFGARFNDLFEVEHSYVESVEDIKAFRGSKYVQSKIGYTFTEVKKFLENGRKVLFSGTPCQIGGLKSFLGKNYENLICIDIICHGVPSPLAWNKYKNEISNGKKITDISFRDKTYGWKDYSFRMEFEDGTSYFEKGSENKYIRGFIGDIYLRNSCYQCKFKTLHRQSDLTLADFWGIENINEDMYDGSGTSFVIVNSEIGNQVLKKIEEKIEIKEVNLGNAIKYNISAIQSSYNNPRRKYFFKNISKLKFDKLVEKSLKEDFIIRLKTKVKKIIKI